jgi:hypothetical protein
MRFKGAMDLGYFLRVTCFKSPKVFVLGELAAKVLAGFMLLIAGVGFLGW